MNEPMQRQGLAYVAGVMLTVGVAACGGTPPPPSTGDPGNSGGDRINGNERLGWTQAAAVGNELATFRYAAYVDNNRSELTDVSCGSLGANGSSCSSRLPAMSAGSHNIELVSFLDDNGTVVESSRSSALRVTMSGSTAGVGAGASTSLSSSARNRAAAESSTTDLTTRDGLHLQMRVITDELESPTALAFAPDGRVFIAERRGFVRTLAGDTLSASSDAIDDVRMAGATDGGLIGLTLDPEFDRTHLAYALYTVEGRDGGLRFRVARFREVNGAFAERAVLMDNLAAAASGPTGAIGVGPDGMLYVAVDDGGDPSQAVAMSSYSGKILRITRDGTTAADQPVYASDQRSPRGLGWQPQTNALWIADQKTGAAGELEMITPDGTQKARGVARARVPLAARVGATSLSFYDGDLLPAFRGDLLIAARTSGQLLRLRFDPRDQTKVLSTERLISDERSLALVAVGTDGAVYLATDRALLRMAPPQ
jgi:glucose/arabinose dehydrogenase